MAEYVQSMHLDFEIQTNKKSVRINREVDTIDEAVELLQELKEDGI